MYKLRFNSVALQALDSNGELPENASFPKGSVLVKEVYRNSVLIVLAVIKKAPTDANAGDGWLWAEMRWMARLTRITTKERMYKLS